MFYISLKYTYSKQPPGFSKAWSIHQDFPVMTLDIFWLGVKYKLPLQVLLSLQHHKEFPLSDLSPLHELQSSDGQVRKILMGKLL